MFQLPQPSRDDQAKSLRLIEKLHAEMAGGPISFADYMAHILYDPELGYYGSGQVRFGPEGDFTTAPERSPFFADGLVYEYRAAQQAGLPAAIMEFGAGSGQLMVDLLSRLEQESLLPEQYLIVEISPALRERQQARLQSLSESARSRVHWIDGPDDPVWRGGVVIANEVLDAMPVERFRWIPGRSESAIPQGVCFDGERLAWCDLPPSQALVAALEPVAQACERWLTDDVPVEPVMAELNLGLPDWLDELNRGLCSDACTWVYLFDYGGHAWDLYRPDRTDGTLRCHYRHLAHDDAFVYPGLQDVTTWVDFDRVARLAQLAGFGVDGERSQGEWLMGTDVPDRFAARLAEIDDRAEAARLSQGLKELVMPTEMGERFRVLRLHCGRCDH